MVPLTLVHSSHINEEGKLRLKNLTFTCTSTSISTFIKNIIRYLILVSELIETIVGWLWIVLVVINVSDHG